MRVQRAAWRAAFGIAAAIGMAAALPAQAQNVCNAQFNIDYVSGPVFGVAGDNYTVEVGIGTGSITGGANNQITIDQWRFELDCANNAFIGCVDEGAIVSYMGDGTIVVGGTGCVDVNGAPVGFTSNNPGGGTAPNQVVFTPSAPIVMDANISPTSDAACQVQFGITIANSPGTDATPLLVQESAGFVATPPFDALCDQPNPIPGTAAQSGQIPLCQECDDGNACTTESCNQTTNVCETTFTQVCNDNDACTTESCDTATGQCVTTFTQTCDDGDLCTDESCNTASGQCETTFTVTCPDPNCEFCNPATGACEDIVPQPPICVVEEICRTPGFWKTHAGSEKGGPNVTGAVLAAASGPVMVCGETLSDSVDVMENMCVAVRGDPFVQLKRQLSAAALNCILSSGGDPTCGGVSIETTFGECNSLCAGGPSSLSVNECIEMIDDFNNGLISDCHDQPLCNEALGVWCDKTGPASSPRQCSDIFKANK